MRTGTEQAIRSAAQAGTDIIKGKNAKEAVQQRTSHALQRTYDKMTGPILARMDLWSPLKRKRKQNLEISLTETL